MPDGVSGLLGHLRHRGRRDGHDDPITHPLTSHGHPSRGPLGAPLAAVAVRDVVSSHAPRRYDRALQPDGSGHLQDLDRQAPAVGGRVSCDADQDWGVPPRR